MLGEINIIKLKKKNVIRIIIIKRQIKILNTT
jgi:hypothetical protein